MHQKLKLSTFNEQDHGQNQQKSRINKLKFEKVTTHNHT